MNKIKIAWEGILNLDQISWGSTIYPEYKPNSSLDEKIKEFWSNHIKKFPNDYDGTLLYLYNFKFENEKLILNVGSIKYSTILYLANNNIPINKGIGMLGVQCLIFSPDKDYILIGQRALTQEYRPGATCIPGGMLEIADLTTNPKISLMREIYEEVPLNFEKDYNLLAILTGWNNVSVTFLLSTVVDNFKNFDPKEMIESDKFEWKSDLRWLSIQKVKDYPDEKIFDGLIYYKSKILEK